MKVNSPFKKCMSYDQRQVSSLKYPTRIKTEQIKKTKLVAKVLANWIIDILPNLIDPDQRGYMIEGLLVKISELFYTLSHIQTWKIS